MTDQLVVPVILCGGAGTRLWPVSREKMPKQFVPLIGALSTFQQVLDRVTCEGLFAPPMIITNSEFRFVVAEQARARGVKAAIILEPQRRDSAAAIAAAAELAMKNDPSAILLVVAADQGAPWQIRLTDDLRARIAEEAPDGYLTMYQAMRRPGVSRQTVWQRVKRGDIEAIHARRGRKKGLRLKLNCSQTDLFNQAS